MVLLLLSRRCYEAKIGTHPVLCNHIVVVVFLIAKRTSDSDVSGYIKVRIAAKIEGDEVVWPFHEQYKKLHDVS